MDCTSRSCVERYARVAGNSGIHIPSKPLADGAGSSLNSGPISPPALRVCINGGGCTVAAQLPRARQAQISSNGTCCMLNERRIYRMYDCRSVEPRSSDPFYLYTITALLCGFVNNSLEYFF